MIKAAVVTSYDSIYRGFCRLCQNKLTTRCYRKLYRSVMQLDM